MPDLHTLRVDPDIRRAHTLPGWAYADAGVYEHAKRAIFTRSWQLVGDSDDVKVPGQVKPVTLLEGCLDEPILLTRDRDDRVHALSNVCTHRGTILCHAAGHEKNLTCRYHGRRFELDGTFKFMPEFEQTAGFPSEKDHLPKTPWGSWPAPKELGSGGSGGGGIGRLLFAGLAPSVTLDEWLAPLTERMGFLRLNEFKFDAARSRKYLVHANWALYVDNYLEGFHIPFVHASLNDALDYGLYRTELFRWGNLQVGLARSGSSDPTFELPTGHPDRAAQDRGERVAAYYWWLFPNLMLNFYPWGLSINVVRPLGVERTRVSFISYVYDESKLDQGAGAGLDRVEREDEAVVEAVQRGLRSRFYDRGRYSPTREQGVHHFHRLWVETMGARI